MLDQNALWANMASIMQGRNDKQVVAITIIRRHIISRRQHIRLRLMWPYSYSVLCWYGVDTLLRIYRSST